MATAADYKVVAQQIYMAYFGRPADPLGLQGMQNELARISAPTTLAGIDAEFRSNGELAKILNNLGNSEEAHSLYTGGDIQFVTAIYLNMLNRKPDTPGLLWWAGELQAQRLTRAQAAISMAAAALNNTSGDQDQGVKDQLLIKNKMAIAANFTASLMDSVDELNAYGGDAAAKAARDLMHNVTADTVPSDFQASVDAAITHLVDMMNSANGEAHAKSFTLTAGVDALANFTGIDGNDTFIANSAAGAVTLTSLDAIDGGAGNDTLTISATAPVDTTTAVNTSVKNIENVVVTSTGAVTVNTTSWTGVTNLTAASNGNLALTGAATTDITGTAIAPTSSVTVDGGKNVAVSANDTAVLGTGSGNTVVIGGNTAAAGTVSVNYTETIADAAGGPNANTSTTGSITVNGGTTISVNSQASVGVGDHTGDIATIGTITVNGDAHTTAVSVTQSAATAAWAATGDKIKLVNGLVNITDVNAAGKSDTITTVSLTNFGNTTIRGNALTTLNLSGGGASATASGTIGLSASAGKTDTAPTALTINMAKGRVGIITDGADQYKTVNVVSAAAATIGGLDFTEATALNVSGAGVTTIGAQTDLGKVAAISSTGGGLSLAGTLGANVAFTGGAGKETIIVGATTKAIATGAGDDSVTVAVSTLGTGGSIDAGAGTDTLTMISVDAVNASNTNTFEGTISGFEKLSISDTASGTINLANLDDLNDITLAASGTVALTNVSSGVNLRLGTGAHTAVTASLANSGSSDVANVFVGTQANGTATTVTGLTLSGFETINIETKDNQTTATGVANAITTLLDADATTINVTGNGGLNIGTFAGTKLTSFNASAVTLGGVSITTGALESAATLTGGAGADTLNAAAADAGVTINGGAGGDMITGSATESSTLNGEAGNDTITGGAAADTIDGGAGIDTYVANNDTQAGANTVVGAVVNLGATALTQSGVFTVTGAYLSASGASVAAGTATYLFNGESSTNAVVVDTLMNIENVTGTAGADYIVGSAASNVISGGAGVDFVTGGAGSDTFVVNVTANADRDIVTDFTSGSGGDVLAFDISSLGLNAADFAVGTGATFVTAAQYNALAAGAASNHIILDTSGNLASATDTGNAASGAMIYIATNTGDIYFDANGDFSAGALIVGHISAAAAAALVSANIAFQA